MPNQKTIENKVKKILEQLAKYLQMHGGNINLIEITKENVAVVEFSGACVGCSQAQVTLEMFIKEAILSRCPEIIDVEASNITTADHTPPGIPL